MTESTVTCQLVRSFGSSMESSQNLLMCATITTATMTIVSTTSTHR